MRSDNADARLTPVGREIGLVDDDRWSAFRARQDAIELARCGLLRQYGLDEQLRRPDVPVEPARRRIARRWRAIAPDIARQLEIRFKYEGYIARQDRQIERFAQMEAKLIPASIDYQAVIGLRNEARQKLAKFTPRSLGQALRISGITPADVTVLAIHLERGMRD